MSGFSKDKNDSYAVCNHLLLADISGTVHFWAQHSPFAECLLCHKKWYNIMSKVSVISGSSDLQLWDITEQQSLLTVLWWWNVTVSHCGICDGRNLAVSQVTFAYLLSVVSNYNVTHNGKGIAARGIFTCTDHSPLIPYTWWWQWFDDIKVRWTKTAVKQEHLWDATSRGIMKRVNMRNMKGVSVWNKRQFAWRRQRKGQWWEATYTRGQIGLRVICPWTLSCSHCVFYILLN